MEFVDNPLGRRDYFLDNIEQKIERFSQELKEEKTQLKLTLETLRALILVDTEDIRFLKFFGEISEFTINISLGNYKVRIPISEPQNPDIFFSITTMLNNMAEELEMRSVSNNYLKATLNAVSKAAFICDEKKKIVYANDKFHKIARFNQNEIQGKSLTDIIDVKISAEENERSNKLFIRRKNTTPLEIILRSQPIERAHPLDRHGFLYTFTIV